MNRCLNCDKLVKNKYCSISCQNSHQNAGRADKKYGEFKLFDVTCNKCQNSFQVEEREKLFPQKELYFCSRSCANSHLRSDESKNKTSQSLKNKRIDNGILREIDKEKNCKQCNKVFYNKIKRVEFCCRSCAASYKMNSSQASRMGLKSVGSQKETRRSKNEIYFAELCKQKFVILENVPMFNGWDADVVIPELKLAILWNGAWHYKQIKKDHSVSQVQNRDKIKLKEIAKFGYESYVIKDMGKYNKSFVENKFQEMLAYLKLNL
jgi:hypothetical protein